VSERECVRVCVCACGAVECGQDQYVLHKGRQSGEAAMGNRRVARVLANEGGQTAARVR